MRQLVSKNIEKLKPYSTEKPITSSSEGTTDQSGPVILSNNENPLGPSPLAVQAIQDHARDIHRYPDSDGGSLKTRLAERLKTGCCTECSKLDVDTEKRHVIADRLVLGGNITETLIVRSRPQIFTLPKGVFQPLAKEERTGDIIQVQPKIVEPLVKVLDRKPKQFAGVRIVEAEAIVSFGRGLKKKEDIPVIEDLAKTIRGVVGCSRPIAEDLKWLPIDQYVGLSGQKVAPKLYIACGISGQIQHITGIQNARVVVAINTDSKAPIFEYADYGIVGDLYKVIPEIAAAVRRLSGK